MYMFEYVPTLGQMVKKIDMTFAITLLHRIKHLNQLLLQEFEEKLFSPCLKQTNYEKDVI